MHNYELVLIFQADLDEATLSAAVDNVEAIINTNKGEILKIDRWGKRRLAYPINKTNEGYYVLYTFNFDPQEVAALRRTLGYNEQILRSLIVRTEGKE